MQASGRSFFNASDWPSDGRGRDPFPLPVPRAVNRSTQCSSARQRGGAAIGRDMRLAEAVRSLNFLSSASANLARHDSWHHETLRPVGFETQAQRFSLGSMAGRIAAYGESPSDLSGRQGSFLKSDDMYVLNQKNLAPYQPSLLNIAKGAVQPKVATELLPPASSNFLLSPEKLIIRSDAEMAEWRVEHLPFGPYWNPPLASDRPARLHLYQQLPRKGFIVLRKQIKA